MNSFREEAHSIPTRDLILILQDQKDLYTEEEFKILQEELESRPENAIQLEDEEAERKESMRKIEEEQRKAQEIRRKKIERLKENGYDGYYEYTTISLVDENSGYISADSITTTLNKMALDGWRLVVGYSNEIGRNSSSSGFGGISSGTNSTIDQNVLIMERYVKI